MKSQKSIENTPLMKLELRESIFYANTDINEENLCSNFTKYDDIMICYKINPLQSRNIEPEQGEFLSSTVFTGHRVGDNLQENKKNEKNNPTKGQKPERTAELPQGLYLFVQQRSAKILNRDERLDMAIEQQKDGLWERNKLGNLLYVRYLYEDGEFVTQLFRQIETEAPII